MGVSAGEDVSDSSARKMIEESFGREALADADTRHFRQMLSGLRWPVSNIDGAIAALLAGSYFLESARKGGVTREDAEAAATAAAALAQAGRHLAGDETDGALLLFMAAAMVLGDLRADL